MATTFRALLHRLRPPTTRARIATLAVIAVVIALVSGGLVLAAGGGGKQITAYFGETIGVYPGSTVRILGVKVGTIDSVTPEGQRVKVTMTVDGNVPVPASAGAVVVAASVVSDRYIQLTPPYTGGPQMADHGVIPERRTATPLEVDQVFSSLTKLANELGPNGVNAHGALSDVLNTGAANLKGNGRNFNTMIAQLGAATRTLSGSRDNLFSTVNNLQSFTTMLKSEDSQVRLAEQQLASVSSFLSGDRFDLTGALHELSIALGQVKTFIESNRSLVKTNVGRLAAITRLLVSERASLAEAIDDAPLAVDNVLGAYNPVSHTLNGRGDLRELDPGATAAAAAVLPSSAPGSASGNAVCASVTSPVTPLGSLCQKEQPGAGALVEVSPQDRMSLPPLLFPAVGPVYGTPRSVQGTRG